MKLCTYVNYPGNCREAFRFYEQHLGGKITMMTTHGQGPYANDGPPEWKNAVLHARIDIGETELFGADIPGCQPMTETFFAFRFAQLRDKFGASWMILHERPRPSA
jgi:PhnB protein